MNKRETHIVTGMTRDMSASRFDNKFVVDARNIRITATKGNSTFLSVTNEKGTDRFAINGQIKGVIIGHAVLNKTLVLFTTEHTTEALTGDDRIYRLDFADDFSSADVFLLFEGDLNFYYKNPLETLPYYENSQIQKVYWVDGKNQPRVIDIEKGLQNNADVFNFNRKIDGKQTFKVTKHNTGGEFPAGTVQYCFNYFNKFGQETNIVDVSPLYYLCPQDKGLPADAMDTSSFTININNIDGNYDYLRLYSIVRTSENATPVVRIVGDYSIQLIKNTTQFIEIAGTELLNPDNIDIIDINTGEVIYHLADVYDVDIPNSTTTVPLEANEYAYDRSTGKIYALFYTTDGLKCNSIVFYDNGTSFYIIPSILNSVIKYTTYTGSTYVKDIVASDNGIIGSTIDASALLFIGGQNIIADTFTSKDNTLFLGNIRQNVPNIGDLILPNLKKLKDVIKGRVSCCLFDYDGKERNTTSANTLSDAEHVSKMSFYDYPVDNNRSSYDTKSFKAREGYRLGVIAQYNTGQWSEVLWVGDYDETYAPGRMVFYNDGGNVEWGPAYRKPGFKLEIPQSIIATLRSAGFIRIAPVVVYPNTAERKILCQGLLCSSVFGVNDRANNTPFAQSDWRFRSGYTWEWIDGEIQCNPVGTAPQYPIAYDSNSNPLSSADFVKIFSTQYYRDPSIISFYSPDIEENDVISSSNLSDVSLRIVGISNLGFNNNYEAIGAESILESKLFDVAEGIYPKFTKMSDYKVQGKDAVIGVGNTLSFLYSGFLDGGISNKVNNDNYIYHSKYLYKYSTFLWHRKGSLNNQPVLSDTLLKLGAKRTGLYNIKRASESRYARTTFFQDNILGPQSFSLSITAPKVLRKDSTLSMFDYGGNYKKAYYGNIDKLLVPPFENTPIVTTIDNGTGTADIKTSNGYPIEVLGMNQQDMEVWAYYGGEFTGTMTWKDLRMRMPEVNSYNTGVESGDEDTYVLADSYGKDPIELKYKSSDHLVFSFSSSSLSEVGQIGNSMIGSYSPFWNETGIDSSFVNVLNGKLNDTFDDYSGLVDNSILVGELYRAFTDEQLLNRFGGTSDEAIANNVWTRCGNSVYLAEVPNIILYYKEGDTYVGRYDCLKTYPYTEEDSNQFVSVYSTELESRVNLDARYDKLRGSLESLYIRPTNFNQYNHPGYEQSNQYFTYKAISYDRYKNLKYPNLVSFTLEKKPGADIDIWTSIPMTSTFDMKGELGEITKLATFNGSVFSFQNRGVAQILFNERVQIPTSDGQPIEITNGFKYGGYRYLSDQIGMTNKWSLCTTPNGIYFIDDEKNTLYQFNGQQFSDLSGKAGFRTWLSDINSYDVWNPVDFNNIRTWYDRVNGDLYFMNDKESLVFSEQIGNFISFMDYAALPVMVNMNDRFLTSTINTVNGVNTMWELWAGEHNMFFDVYKPYWLTFISNTDPTVDKVFDNLAWRTFDYSEYSDEDKKGILQPLTTFDTLRVWHDHQDTGDVELTNTPNKPSPLKKKFNVFRAVVPRDRLGLYAKAGRDRIRNTWSYIQLSRYNENTDLMAFTDLEVDFFE